MLRSLPFALALALGVCLSPPVWAAGSDGPSSSTSPRTVDPRYQAAETAVKQENFDQAIVLLSRIVAANPGHADAWNYLGFSLRKSARPDDALTAYKKALAIDPNHRGANEYLGELYVETGRLDLARERLKRLDSICLFGCEEYDDLKEKIRTAGG